MRSGDFLRPLFSAALEAQLLALNNAHAEELSYKTAEQFSALLASASVILAEPGGLALLVGFHDHCVYDNPNFRWLKARYPRFIYIDRVVVSAEARGRGLATKLYGLVEEQARRDDRQRLVCEINAVPPNLVSDGFHRRLGFLPVGEQALGGAGKIVRYWAKELGGST